MEDPIAFHNSGHFHTSVRDRAISGPHSRLHISPQSSSSYRAPPSPPNERMQGFNLPPIADLLNLSRQEGSSTSHRPQTSSQSRRPHSPSSSHFGSHKSLSQNASPNSNGPPNGGSFLLPPTPPLKPVQPLSQLSQPQHHSPSSVLPPPTFSTSFLSLDPPQSSHSDTSQYSRHTSLPTPIMHQRTSYAASSHSESLHSSPRVGYDSHTSQSRHRSMPRLITQQPLPTDFPPNMPSHHMPSHSTLSACSSTDASVTSSAHTSWQSHHSHMSPTTPNSASPFNTSQDRYVCPTCTKAFSRPSSLKIHSHSHTGEKPFKCPHKGCGKAFSVRSNMKRHERGCHAERGIHGDHVSTSGSVASSNSGMSRELLPAS